MFFQRCALTVLTLTLLQVPCAAGDNPFARWDQLSRETTAATSATSAKTPVAAATTAPAKTAPVTAFEYFSASAATPAVNSTAAASDSAGKVNVERLQVKPRQTPSTANRATANRAAAAAKSPAATRPEVQVPVIDFGISNAKFQPNSDSPAIQQVNDILTDGNLEADASNPFADFLEEKTASPAVNVSAFDQTLNQDPPKFDDVSEFDSISAAVNTKPVDTSDAGVASSHKGPQTPSVTLQWVHHGELNVGQECRCDLVLENTGRSTVRNVVAEAVIPEGVEVLSSEPAPVATNGSATWTFGELKPGQTRKVELVVIPHRQGDLQMNAFVRLTGASTASFSVREPLVKVRLEGPSTIEVGQLVNYTIHVANPGNGEARNVVIQAAIPAGMEHRRGQMLTIEIGTLNPGESRRARLSVTGVTGGEHELAVRVVADGGLADQTIETVAINEPRLNIGVRGPAQSIASQPCDYEVIVVNESKVDSNNVRAKYRVPAGFDFVSADRGAKYLASERTIDWFVGTLEPGQLKHFKVTLQPTKSGDFKHQVGVISEHGRMTMAEHSTSVQGNAKLALSVASSSPQVKAGEIASFEIRIQNSGDIAAAGVGLSCELPAGLELVEISGPSEYIADSGVVIFRSLPSLASGESADFVVKARCTRSGHHSARVRVASESIARALIDEETVRGVAR